MKVNQVNIFVGEDSCSGRKQLLGMSQQEGNRSAFFAGTLNQDIDPIGLKKQMAQKKALKVVSDAFAADRKLDSEIADRESRIKDLRAEKAAAEKAVKELEDQKLEIGRAYGLGEEGLSDEDWDILEKGSMLPTALTDEEKVRYAEMQEQGLTEYYGRCRDIDDLAKPYRQLIRENDNQIEAYESMNQSIHKARLDLKNNPMIAAQKEADAIMEAASKEIISMLIDESKEHIDEEMQEKVEQAKEEKEEKEEQEEKLEAIREEKVQLESQAEAIREKARENEKRTEELLDSLPMEELLQMDNSKTDFQQELKEIMDKMKLLEEDIKGTTVDESL